MYQPVEDSCLMAHYDVFGQVVPGISNSQHTISTSPVVAIFYGTPTLDDDGDTILEKIRTNHPSTWCCSPDLKP
jgi:hypothetical protein